MGKCKCLESLQNLFSGGGNTPDPEPTPDPIEPEPTPDPIEPVEPIKKALLVGINSYPPEMDSDLNGCINDVMNMRDLLISQYGFESDNIRILTNGRATKANILARLEWLIDSNKGDELVFHYSGHGSQVRDRNGDELEDYMDEILIPYDHNWDDPLLDDTLAEIFQKQPQGTNLTMVADCCHSGTITRNSPKPPSSKSEKTKKKSKPRFLKPPIDIHSRSMDRELSLRKIGAKPKGTQRHILISGCKDNQYSADAYIGLKWQGAFTYALTTTLKENPNISWSEAYEKLSKLLLEKDYEQTPQLSGDNPDKLVFGGV